MYAKHIALLLSAIGFVHGQSQDASAQSDFLSNLAFGFNSAAAEYLATASYDKDALLSAETANPTEIFSALATVTDGPDELALLKTFASLIPETARSVIEDVLDVALSLQAQGDASADTTASTTGSAEAGLITASSSTRVSGVAGHGTGTNGVAATKGGPGSGGQGNVPSQSIATAAAAKPTDAGLMAMAGIVAGVAGLAVGL